MPAGRRRSRLSAAAGARGFPAPAVFDAGGTPALPVVCTTGAALSRLDSKRHRSIIYPSYFAPFLFVPKVSPFFETPLIHRRREMTAPVTRARTLEQHPVGAPSRIPIDAAPSTCVVANASTR